MEDNQLIGNYDALSNTVFQSVQIVWILADGPRSLIAALQNQPKPPQKRVLGKKLGIAVDNSPYTFPTKTRQNDFPPPQDTSIGP
jgi:hypothetical protein